MDLHIFVYVNHATKYEPKRDYIFIKKGITGSYPVVLFYYENKEMPVRENIKNIVLL